MASETVRKREVCDTTPQSDLYVENLNDYEDIRPSRSANLVHGSTAPRPKPWLNLKRKFDLDADVLLCRICTEHLSAPVYQCRDGHTVCSPCSKRLVRGCPSCSKPIGRIRCMTAEKILESLTMSCKYASEGCTEMLKFNKLEEHEQSRCKYVTTPCPMPHCCHEGAKLTIPKHLTEEHGVQEVGTTEALCKSLHHGCDECCRGGLHHCTSSNYVMVKDKHQSVSLVRVEEVA